MKAVYEAPYPIPELGIQPGDIITLRPSHPTNPFLVTRRIDRSRMPLLLDHLDRLTPLSLSASHEVAEEELRRQMLRRSPPPPASMRRRLRLRVE